MQYRVLTQHELLELKFGSPEVDIRKARLLAYRMHPEYRYPVVEHFLHNDYGVKCGVAFEEGVVHWLELPLEYFNQLPTVEIGGNQD